MTWRVWTQYNPTNTRRDLQIGLQARLHDPYWLLARQWQLGEFAGEDAGSPIRVRVETDTFRADRLQLGDRTVAYHPAGAPLEALVERESAEQVGPDLRMRAQWGQLFTRYLAQDSLPFDRSRLDSLFGFSPADRDATAGLDSAARVLIRRSLDAASIYSHFTGDEVTDAELLAVFPGTVNTALPHYRTVIERWLRGYEERGGRPGQGDAWLEDRAEYAFKLSVPTDIGRIELDAPEYHGGRLDWDAFRVGRVLSNEPPATPVRSHAQLLATQITYQGMPAPRFWEFEDAAVDFGDPAAGDRDLGRLLLAEVAMAWGNDWFQIPVEAPYGSLVRVNRLEVTDTFGVTTSIVSQRLHNPAWTMNRLSESFGSAAAPFLWLPPVLPHGHESAPVEEVLFARDEMANMAWAIETVVPDPLGRPQSQRDQPNEPPRGLLRLIPNTRLRYDLMPDMPDHWLPLMPVRQPTADGTDQAIFLKRGGLLEEGQQLPSLPKGALLGANEGFQLHEEEVPRSGANVTRAWQLVRWYDGRHSLWVGRRKRAGMGEIRSGLEFDMLLPVESEQ